MRSPEHNQSDKVEKSLRRVESKLENLGKLATVRNSESTLMDGVKIEKLAKVTIPRAS